MWLAMRNLLQDKARFALSVLGVALAVMLILVLQGLMSGMRRQAGAYLEHAPGPLVVTGDGTQLLPPGLEEEARRVPGVSRVVPILSQTAFFELHGKKILASVVGYDPAQGGGPWRIAEGREPRQGYEMVVDRTLARQHGVEVGQRIEVTGLKFPVVGLAEGTGFWMSSRVFVRKAALETLMLVPGLTSFLLVTPAPGLPPEVLRGRLRALSGGEVWLKSELIERELQSYGPFFKPIQLMTVMAFLVGTLVVGLVIHTATLERQREYGVLKALGARKGVVYRLVASQALIVAALGSLLGLLLAWGTAELIMALRPQFLVTLEPRALVLAVGLGLVMALVASLFPARLMAGLAPAEVFRR